MAFDPEIIEVKTLLQTLHEREERHTQELKYNVKELRNDMYTEIKSVHKKLDDMYEHTRDNSDKLNEKIWALKVRLSAIATAVSLVVSTVGAWLSHNLFRH